jgi:hypothetical protein
MKIVELVSLLRHRANNYDECADGYAQLECQIVNFKSEISNLKAEIKKLKKK